MEPASPGMHTSDSIDFGYVISGSIWLELDDGSARELRAGDTYVQNGTRYALRNRSSEPCSILVTLIGVRREPSGLSVAKGSIPHTETPRTADRREHGQGTGSAS